MCLSTAYENEIDEKYVIMDNVAEVATEDNYVILTDLFERKQKIEGSILKINLTENYVIIKRK